VESLITSTIRYIVPVSELPPRIALMISVQRALLGAVTDKLVTVTCGFAGTEIRINAYFDSEPSEEDIEEIQCVGTEVIADFPAPYTIHESCSVIPPDNRLEKLDFTAFRRAGHEGLTFG
jgi:hypothetical protein